MLQKKFIIIIKKKNAKMQKSPSKFHTLSFQFSKFYFFSIKFFINQPLVVAVTIFCFITFQFSPTALSKKKKKKNHLQLLHQLGSMSEPKLGPISI